MPQAPRSSHPPTQVHSSTERWRQNKPYQPVTLMGKSMRLNMSGSARLLPQHGALMTADTWDMELRCAVHTEGKDPTQQLGGLRASRR